MLFPVSRKGKIYFRKSRYTVAVIFSNEEVKDRVPYLHCLNSPNDNIERKPHRPFLSKQVYLEIIKSLLCLNRVYCDKEKIMVDLKYCFSSCRFAKKIGCNVYMNRLWGCMACEDGFHTTCNKDKLENCTFRKYHSRLVQFYFSQLCYYDYLTLNKFKYGAGYKKNFMGIGPQIYFNVGGKKIHGKGNKKSKRGGWNRLR